MNLDQIAAEVHRITKGIEDFAAEMKRKKIHIGMGNPPICATCGKPWKECQKAKPRTLTNKNE